MSTLIPLPSMATDETPQQASPANLDSPDPAAKDKLEVSLIEASDAAGVTFTPELWMQRRHWALDVLRREQVRSVLDMGCGAGSLLEPLVIPPDTIAEPPITSGARPNDALFATDSHAEGDNDEECPELFLHRIGGIDVSPSVLPFAIETTKPPSPNEASSSSRPYVRWEPLESEIWLGGLEKYNPRLEGYEAIVALEVIEHLEPDTFSSFALILGTYRPKLLLITTPNFDFNAKFPRVDDGHDHGETGGRRGYADPTGRTERVFRHSDHKLEMTANEFKQWAESAADDWGYTVEVSGLGASSSPSFYEQDPELTPEDRPRPIYASQTAIFRLSTGLPMRSPRSIRSVELPFMSGHGETNHAHKLAARHLHPVHIPGVIDSTKQSESPSYQSVKLPPRKPAAEVRALVKEQMQRWNIGLVSVQEIWSQLDIAVACGGSKRWLIGSLGGWGNCAPVERSSDEDLRVVKERGRALSIKWASWKPAQSAEVATEGYTPHTAERTEEEKRTTGGW